MDKVKVESTLLFVYSHCNCDFRETMIKLSFDVCHEVMPVQHMIRPAISNSPWQKAQIYVTFDSWVEALQHANRKGWFKLLVWLELTGYGTCWICWNKIHVWRHQAVHLLDHWGRSVSFIEIRCLPSTNVHVVECSYCNRWNPIDPPFGTKAGMKEHGRNQITSKGSVQSGRQTSDIKNTVTYTILHNRKIMSKQCSVHTSLCTSKTWSPPFHYHKSPAATSHVTSRSSCTMGSMALTHTAQHSPFLIVSLYPCIVPYKRTRTRPTYHRTVPS